MDIKSSTKKQNLNFFTRTLLGVIILVVINSGVSAQTSRPTPEATPVESSPAEKITSDNLEGLEQKSIPELPTAIESDELNELDTIPEESSGSSLWVLVVKGGWTMLGLALISAIIIGFIMERTYLMRRQKISVNGYNNYLNSLLESGDLNLLRQSLAGDERLISKILSQGLEQIDEGTDKFEQEITNTSTVELGTLERGLNLLSGMGNLAPLLGFFGTVVGMRNSFLQFVEKAAPTAQDLAGGVEEALITTAAGLLIAIPTYLVHNVFVYMIDSLTIELERSSNLIIKRFK